MTGGPEGVIAPALQQVCDIDDEGTGDRRSLDPFTSIPYLQGGDAGLLRENGETLVVGVRADADLAAVGLDRLRRVTIDAQHRDRVGQMGFKVILG